MITEYDLVSGRKGVLLPGSAQKSKTSNTLCSCQGTMWTRRAFIYHCGDNIMWDPPVLIPNTEVKPHRADGTVRDTVWESRTLPHFIERVRADSPDFFLCFQPQINVCVLSAVSTRRAACFALAVSERLRKARLTSLAANLICRLPERTFARPPPRQGIDNGRDAEYNLYRKYGAYRLCAEGV